jgi:hypothetical protein
MPGLSTFQTDHLEMSLLSTVDRSSVIRPRAASRTTAGEQLYCAGTEGLGWRLHSGVIRLDTTGPDGDAALAGLVAGEF